MEGYRNNRRRKVANRPVHVSFLIVTEGTTEKLYLDNMVHRLSRVVIRDKGKSSVRLVKEAIAYKQREEFDRIWVVFDKDDNNDFNEAIDLARNNDINVAWSNEAFELWFYLHFQYLSNAVSRSQYITMIEREIRKIEPNFKYSKTDKGMYERLQTCGSEETAVSNADKLLNLYSNNDFASHNPGTMVHHLVRELRHPEELLKPDNKEF